MSSVIVGTAGHIDHGKTSLIRALTGVDTDRLPEEKRRGITIDLGFAEMTLGKLSIGFIDVPGHERFVKNMLAGAHGIDLVVLVVAADEGVMPQTIEHFEICRLLGVKSGLVAITKVDTVDAELLELVSSEVEELVAGSFLEGAPILPVSAKTLDGLDTLKSTLKRLANSLSSRLSQMDNLVPRLPIDRSFSIRGFGTVVTGTLVSGRLTDSASMELLPGKTAARIRGIQHHGTAVKSATAGQRTAVNLGGLELTEAVRGMTLIPVDTLRHTQMIDARCEMLETASKNLGQRMRVRVHIGTAEVLARVRVFGAKSEVESGDKGFIQLRFESPVVALPGDRFILRSYSPARTIGGGVVLDNSPVKLRSKNNIELSEKIERLSGTDLSGQITAFVSSAGTQGLVLNDLVARTGYTAEFLRGQIESTKSTGVLDEFGGFLVPQNLFREVSDGVKLRLRAFHRDHPVERGLSRELLRTRNHPGIRPEIFRGMIEKMAASGSVVVDKELVRLSSHVVALSEEVLALKVELEHLYERAGLEPPATDDAISSLKRPGVKSEDVHRLLKMLIEEKILTVVSGDLIFHTNSIKGMISAIRTNAAGGAGASSFDIQKFKELTGISRKYAIPLLEYLDRVHVTRRTATGRMVL